MTGNHLWLVVALSVAKLEHCAPLKDTLKSTLTCRQEQFSGFATVILGMMCPMCSNEGDAFLGVNDHANRNR